MAKTRQPTEVRRAQIKEAVQQIIFEKGFKGLSIHNLSKELNLSEGAIYRHFESKEQIILDIVKDVRDQMIYKLEEIANSSLPAGKRLEDFMCYHLQYLIKNKGITILLFTEATYQQNNKLKNKLREIFQAIKDAFKKIIKDGVDNGEWSSSLAVESMAILYMSIPLTLNIEINLGLDHNIQDNFCDQMYQLIVNTIKNSE